MTDSNFKQYGAGRKVGYVWVSKREMKEYRQTDRLEKVCDAVFIEKISAVAKSRPVLDKLLADLKPGDSFVILDLDRGFRSTLEAIQTLTMLKERDINFQILNTNIDTSTELGEVIFSVLATFAAYERRVLIRRTREGLAAARRRGKRLGRPLKLTDEQVREAYALIQCRSQPVYKVARKMRVSQNTLKSSFVRLGLMFR